MDSREPGRLALVQSFARSHLPTRLGLSRYRSAREAVALVQTTARQAPRRQRPAPPKRPSRNPSRVTGAQLRPTATPGTNRRHRQPHPDHREEARRRDRQKARQRASSRTRRSIRPQARNFAVRVLLRRVRHRHRVRLARLPRLRRPLPQPANPRYCPRGAGATSRRDPRRSSWG